MKDYEIIEQFIMDAYGGVDTDDNKSADRALIARLPYWKQMALLQIYNGSKTSKANTFINAQNFYPAEYNYDQSIQVEDADFVLFEIEPAINLDDRFNGYSFVGDKLTGKAFTQLKHRGTYSTAKDAGLIDINEVYYEASGTLLKVWGNIQLRTLYMDYIPADVMNIPTFNPQTDEYPVSQDVLKVMFQIALPELLMQAGRPADYVNNSAPNEGGAK